jgi:hypothetical protein
VEFARDFFSQIESQVQFGDTKASLLIAGDAILLATTSGLVRMVSGCPADKFSMDCVQPSLTLGLATAAALLLILSLACALWAARPSGKHWDRTEEEFFLLGQIAKADFAERYQAITEAKLLSEVLLAIRNKAKFALKKFCWLRRAIDATLLSLVLMLATLLLALVPRFGG